MTNESNEPQEPDERPLTWPSQHDEVYTFLNDVPRKTMGDGGQYIDQVRTDALDRLFADAAKAKAKTAQRLGLDADGRRWFEMPAADLNRVSYPAQNAMNQIRWFIDSLLDVSRGSYGPLDPERADVVRLRGELNGGTGINALRVALSMLLDTLRMPDAYGTSSDRLALLRELPTTGPDANGKVRTVRTAKWLKKWVQLVSDFRGEYPVDIDVQMSRIADDLAKAKQFVCISANPLDFLLSATRQVCDFTSCHSLDGMHAHGNSAYCRDGHTFLVFVAPDRTAGFPFFKTGRAWMYIGSEDQIILGRAYGRGVSVTLASYIVRQVEMLLRPNEVWRVRHDVRIDSQYVDNIGHSDSYRHMDFAGYFDLAASRVAVPRSLLVQVAPPQADEEDEVVLEQRFRRIADVLPTLEFADGVCLACNDEIDRCDSGNHMETPFCGECSGDSDYFECYDCGGRHHNDDLRTHSGDSYCTSCFDDRFFYCERCGNHENNDEATRVYRRIRSWDNSIYTSEALWCESCVGNYAHRCECCDEWWRNTEHFRMIETVDEELICYDCRDRVNECADCGNVTLNTDCPDADDHDAERAAADAEAIDRLDSESPATTQEVTHA